MSGLHTTRLYERLRELAAGGNENATLYAGSLVELERQVGDLLGRIVVTFPHYTDHTLRHSLAIVKAIGDILPAQTLETLSATELYIVMASALLHDSGMVVPEAEYAATEKLDSFVALRDAPELAELMHAAQQAPDEGNFWTIAFARRTLIAEWYRRQHAARSAKLILELSDRLIAPDYGHTADLAQRVAKVCEAHAYDAAERMQFENDRIFPRKENVRDDTVDLALCALLLRIGDLLDLTHRRTCPLSLRVAEPLPGESRYHWERHDGTITTKEINSERIRIIAECKSQEAHALLHGWCEWLREEVTYATSLTSRSERRLQLPPPEISITPTRDAGYIFREYRLRIDEREIFEQMFRERLYGNKALFVRELLQNAIDATRCRLIDDVRAGKWKERLRGVAVTPEMEPREYPREIRNEYPIRIALEQTADRKGAWHFRINDCGIGMDDHTIRDFLLTVGRSYYQSFAFRERYLFRPIGEFGIGLLSCFMVSMSIEIDTLRPSGSDGAIHLNIPPWKQYLLTRKGDRTEAGTEVSLSLESLDWLEPNPYASFLVFDQDLGRTVPSSRFGRLIQSIARHVEFPVDWSAPDGDGRITDPWDEETGGEGWTRFRENVWSRAVQVPDQASGRVYLGRFRLDHKEQACSKEGISCLTRSEPDERMLRFDIDLRGSLAPKLTLDRRNLVSTPASLGSALPHLVDPLTLAQVEADLAFRDGVRTVLGKLPDELLLPVALTPLLDHLTVLWINDGEGVQEISLASLLADSPRRFSIQIESAPGRAAEDAAEARPVTVVLPLTQARHVPALAFQMRRILEEMSRKIARLNGYPVDDIRPVSPEKRGVFECRIDISPWAVVRMDPVNWVISDELAEAAIRHSATALEFPLYPRGKWSPWAPIIHRVNVKEYEPRDVSRTDQRPPDWALLRGIENVRQTLLDYIPDLPTDLLHNEALPERDRSGGYGIDIQNWQSMVRGNR